MIARLTPESLEHAYGTWTEALAAGDLEAFRALLDERWFGTDREGSVLDAADWRAFAAAAPAGATLAEHEARVHGHFAVARGTLRSGDGDQTRFVSLWHDNGAGPRCLTHHDTRVIESAFAEKPPTTRLERRPLEHAASATAIGELNAAYEELSRAMPAQDLAHLDRVIDEDWFTTDPSGELRDKPQYMEFARLYYAPTLTFDVGELFVRETPPFAAVSCRYTLGGRFGHGVAPNQAVRVTGIWRRTGEGWMYVAQQGSFIP